MSKAVKWAWVYGGLHAEVFDSLEDAIAAAIHASDYGEESFDSIEHEGERIGWSHPMFRAAEDARRAQEEAERKSRKPATHRLEVREAGGGKWVPVYGVTLPLSDAMAEEMRDYVEVLGEERVRLKKVTRR